MKGTAAICLMLSSGVLANGSDPEERFYPPTLSCFESGKQPLPREVLRTPVLVSPDGRLGTYAEIESSFDENASPPCRTNARLLVSSGKLPFETAFVEKTSKEDDAAVSLGPIAWSRNSRWLVVERAAGYYASDFGAVDFVLYDSNTKKSTTPDVLGAIAKKMGKHCVLTYRSFGGFDGRNRLILRIADWQNADERQTTCIEGTAEWLFDPVTAEVQPSSGRPRFRANRLLARAAQSGY